MKMKRAGRGGKRRPARGRTGSKLLIALTVGTFTLLGFGWIYQHARLSRMLDARLGETLLQQTAIYSRPERLNAGQRIEPASLIDRLQRSGYHRITSPDRPDWFEMEGRLLTVHQTAAKGRQEIEVEFSEDQKYIARLRLNGKRARRVELRREFISNLAGYSQEKRRHVGFEDLSRHTIQAILAAEDERFFSHTGMDLLATIRAALVNLMSWEKAQGGSTLTQQFVKNYFLTPEKSLRRKLEEAYLSALLEKRLTKKEIFELYINEVYLGQMGSFSIVGLGAASDAFFGKNVKDLSLAESALLAGMIQAPNRFSPHDDADDALRRRNWVLDRMEELEFITTRDNAQARSLPIQVHPQSRQNVAGAPYFVDHVRELLKKESVAIEGSRSFAVFTTLDLDLQRAAYDAMLKGLAQVDERLARRRKKVSPQVALVAVDPRSGEVLAMLGGRNYASSQYNRAVRAERQPGSTFKPFVLAAALQAGLEGEGTWPRLTLASLVTDEPHTFHFGTQEYSPRNHGDKYLGPVSVRTMIAQSLNVATVKVAEQVGYDTVATFSRRHGLERVEAYPSAALGAFEVTPLQLVEAYTALANQGVRTPLRSMEALVIDGDLKKWPRAEPRQILEPEVAFLVTSALQSVLNEGTGAGTRSRGFLLPAAGKTGTSDDSWFIGYTPELLCAVWVGLDDSTSLDLSGSQAALPVWTEFMLQAQRLGYLSGRDFEAPANIVAVDIDPHSGLLAGPDCGSGRLEYFIRGTEPTQFCPEDGWMMADADSSDRDDDDDDRDEDRKEEKKKKGGFWGFWKRILR